MSSGYGGGLPGWGGRDRAESSDGLEGEHCGESSSPYGRHDPYAQHDPYSQGFADPSAAAGGAYAPGPYPAGPPVHGAFAPPPPSSGAAITGFVLGLLGVLMCGGLTAPFGLVFSAIGMKETGAAAPLPKGGRGLAIAGLVTSLIGMIPLLTIVLYIVVFGLAALSAS